MSIMSTGINMAARRETNVVIGFIGDTSNLAASIGRAETLLGSFASRVGAIGATLSSIGMKMTLFTTLPIVGIGAASVKAASDFDKSMRYVNTITKLGTAEYKKMSDAVLNMSKVIPQSATAISDALYYIVSAGFSAADAMVILEASGKAATAGMTDVTTAATVATAVLNSYKLPVSQLNSVFDVLFKGVEQGVFTFADLAGSMGNFLTTAALAGVPIQMAMAVLGTATQAGMNISMATVGLNQIITSIIKPTDDAKAAIRQMGIAAGLTGNDLDAFVASFSASGLQAKGLDGILGNLQKAFKASGMAAVDFSKISDEDYDAMVAAGKGTNTFMDSIVRLFPNVRAMRTVAALLGGDMQTFNKNIGLTAGAAGTTAGALNEALKSTSNQWELMKNKVSAAAITLGTALLPTLLKVMTAVGNFADKLAALPQSTIELILKIGMTVAAMGPLVLITGKLVSGFGVFLAIMDSVAGTLTPVIASLKTLGGVMTKIPVMNIGKIFGGGKVLTSDLTKGLDVFPSLVPPNLKMGGGLGAKMSNSIANMFAAITSGGSLDKLKGLDLGPLQAKLLQPFTSPAYNGIIYRISEAKDKLVSEIGRIYKAPFSLSGIIDSLKKFGANIADPIRRGFATLNQMFTAPMYGDLIYKLGEAKDRIVSTISRVFRSPLNLSGIITGLRGFATNVANAITSGLGTAFNALRNINLGSIPSSVRQLGSRIASTIGSGLSSGFTVISGLATGLYARVKQMVGTLVGGIGSRLASMQAGGIAGLVGGAKVLGAKIASAVTGGISGAMTAAKGANIGSLVSGLVGGIGSLGGAIAKFGAIGMGILGPIGLLVGLIANASAISGPAADVAKKTADAAAATAEGLQAQADAATQAATDAAAASAAAPENAALASDATTKAAAADAATKAAAAASVASDEAAKAASAAGGLSGIFSQIMKDLKPLIDGVKLLLPIFMDTLRPILATMGAFANTMMPLILDGVKGLLGFVGQLFTAVGPLITTLMNFMTTVLPAVMPLFEKIGSILITIVNLVVPLITSIMEPLEKLMLALADAIGKILDAILPIIEAVLPPLLDFIGTLIKAILPVITTLLPMLVPVIEQIADIILNMVNTVLPPIMTFLSAVMPIIVQLAGSLLGGLITMIGSLLTALTPLINQIMGVLGDLLTALLPVISDLIITLLPPIVGLITDLMPLITGLISIALVPLKLIMDILDPILRGFIWIIEQLTKGLSFLIEHIFGPVLDAIGKVASTVGDVLGKIASWLPFSPAEQGPMSKPVGWNEYLTAGIGDAVGGAEKELSALDLSTLADKILSLKDLKIDWEQIFSGLGDVLTRLQAEIQKFADNIKSAVSDALDVVPSLTNMAQTLASTEWAISQVPSEGVGSVARAGASAQGGGALSTSPLGRVAVIAMDEQAYSWLEGKLRTQRDQEDKRRGN